MTAAEFMIWTAVKESNNLKDVIDWRSTKSKLNIGVADLVLGE